MNKSSIKTFFALALAFAFILSFTNVSFAADKEVKIKTSAVGDACKSKIENNLKTLDGIIKSELDINNKFLTVKYDDARTNPNDIRAAVSKLGYDADNVKAIKDDCTTEAKKECSDKPQSGCSSKTSVKKAGCCSSRR